MRPRQAARAGRRPHDPQCLGGLRFRPRTRRRHAAQVGARFRAGPHRAARRGHRPRQRLPARPVAGNGRARPARHHGRGRVRRLGPRLSRALRGDGGDFARQRRGRPVLWRAFQSLRQPAQPQRQCRAEKEISAQADFRRACRRAGDVGAGRRLRRGVDAHARRQEGRPLHPQRLENVDHQRPGRRHAGGLCQDRPHRRRARHHRLHCRERHEGLCPGAEARQARHARLRHQRTGVHRLRGAGGQRAGRGRQRRQRADVRPRLRARGAGGRAAWASCRPAWTW